MTKRKTFTSSLIVDLPEFLGYLDEVYAHITIDGKVITQKAEHLFRYISSNNLGWPKVYYKISDKPVIIWNDFNTSSFKVEMELCAGMEGDYYFTFIGWKYGFSTSYYTETRHFMIGG